MGLSPLLICHISAGSVALISGVAAIAFGKGSPGHRLAGRIFVVAMLCMSASGAYLAFMRSEAGNVLSGIITFYMVATAWSTARRREGATGIFDWVALVVVLTFGAAVVTFGVEAVRSLTGLKEGYPPIFYFVWASVALLCASGDIRMLARGGVFGAQRLGRHIWRMCLALFIAAGSFFLGQQKVMPMSWRGSPLLFAPPLIALLLMIFWLVRVRFARDYKSAMSSRNDCLPGSHSLPSEVGLGQTQSLPGR